MQFTIDTIYWLLSVERKSLLIGRIIRTISSCSTMVAKKWTLARSGNGGHNRRARPSLLETATRGFIDSRQTFVRPRFVLGRVNNWGISVADREAVDFKTFHFGLLAEISLWAITCNAYDLEGRIVNTELRFLTRKTGEGTLCSRSVHYFKGFLRVGRRVLAWRWRQKSDGYFCSGGLRRHQKRNDEVKTVSQHVLVCFYSITKELRVYRAFLTTNVDVPASNWAGLLEIHGHLQVF